MGNFMKRRFEIALFFLFLIEVTFASICSLELCFRRPWKFWDAYGSLEVVFIKIIAL